MQPQLAVVLVSMHTMWFGALRTMSIQQNSLNVGLQSCSQATMDDAALSILCVWGASAQDLAYVM